jgi:hypothetical protein
LNLTLTEIKNSEIVHFYSDSLLVTSLGNKIKIKRNLKENLVKLPVKKNLLPFYAFRILRRLLRLDKMNVFVIGEETLDLIIMYQGSIYHLNDSQPLHIIGKLGSGRNILHNSAAVLPDGSLVFGEYFGNNNGKEVNLYKVDVKNYSVSVIYSFAKNSIRHVHACYWDKFSQNLYVFTGDFNGECKIVVLDKEFNMIKVLGDGSQDYRAVSAFFTKDCIYWLMDSPIESSHLVRFSRDSGEISKLQKFPSPIYYSAHLQEGGYLMATTHEPGPSVKGNSATLYYSEDLEDWKEIKSFEHDGMSLKYFKYGIIGFSSGLQSINEFYIYCEALKGMDGKSYKCSLIE